MRTALVPALVALVLSTPASGGAPAEVAAECGTVRILSSALSSREAEAYCRYAVAEREKVEKFWGATWKETIRVHVDPSYRISRALVPAHLGNRGLVEMPLRGVRNNDGALLHEIVHVYAPNGNRFLAEGLAVYVHQKLAGNRAFPNFGRPLDSEARARLSGIQSLEGLDGVRTPAPLGTVLREQDAYVLAGSFVGFLIERYGLEDFRKLYDGGSYETAYGRSLGVLEKEWRLEILGAK
jgi:hypothetical protein